MLYIDWVEGVIFTTSGAYEPNVEATDVLNGDVQAHAVDVHAIVVATSIDLYSISSKNLYCASGIEFASAYTNFFCLSHKKVTGSLFFSFFDKLQQYN